MGWLRRPPRTNPASSTSTTMTTTTPTWPMVTINTTTDMASTDTAKLTVLTATTEMVRLSADTATTQPIESQSTTHTLWLQVVMLPRSTDMVTELCQWVTITTMRLPTSPWSTTGISTLLTTASTTSIPDSVRVCSTCMASTTNTDGPLPQLSPLRPRVTRAPTATLVLTLPWTSHARTTISSTVMSQRLLPLISRLVSSVPWTPSTILMSSAPPLLPAGRPTRMLPQASTDSWA